MSFQLRIRGYDSATPQIAGETVVFVTVRRNENKPLFSSITYRAQINSTWPQGQVITQVRADDKDGSRVYYSLTADEKAMEYFYIDPDTGVISLKKTIADDNSPRYQVRSQSNSKCLNTCIL